MQGRGSSGRLSEDSGAAADGGRLDAMGVSGPSPGAGGIQPWSQP